MVNNALMQLKVITDQGHVIYANYLANGKTFHYAKQLFDNNLEKLNELEVIMSSSNEAYVSASQKLVEHIKSWQAQWLELQKLIAPSDSDEFVFISKLPYPKEAELILSGD